MTDTIDQAKFAQTGFSGLMLPVLEDAMLALRLDKSLTARLMPIPGKATSDPTGFDFAFFANSRVLGLEAGPLTRHLAGDESFLLSPRKR